MEALPNSEGSIRKVVIGVVINEIIALKRGPIEKWKNPLRIILSMYYFLSSKAYSRLFRFT